MPLYLLPNAGCCRIADVDAGSRFVAETTEGEGAVYVGVLAVVLIAMPICLIVIMDVISFARADTAPKSRKRLNRTRRRRFFKFSGQQPGR